MSSITPSAEDTALKARIHAQSKFHHEITREGSEKAVKATKHEVQVMRQRAEREVSTIHASFRRRFFNDRENVHMSVAILADARWRK